MSWYVRQSTPPVLPCVAANNGLLSRKSARRKNICRMPETARYSATYIGGGAQQRARTATTMFEFGLRGQSEREAQRRCLLAYLGDVEPVITNLYRHNVRVTGIPSPKHAHPVPFLCLYLLPSAWGRPKFEKLRVMPPPIRSWTPL